MNQSPDKRPSKKAKIAAEKAKLQNRLAQLEARERDAIRKEATRIRIVLGAVLLARATKLVEQRDAKAAGFLLFLRGLSKEITRPADAAAKASIEQLIGEFESEMAKPRLAEQTSSAASPKLAHAAQPSPQAVQEPSQPSQAQQPSQQAQQPSQRLQDIVRSSQQAIGQWPTAKGPN